MRGDYETAPIAILFALVFDGLDGRVARLTNTSEQVRRGVRQSADMVSFGVAPALVMFSWALGDLGKAGWSAAFIYVACAALRLARFNTQVGVADPNYFMGLASPAAACIWPARCGSARTRVGWARPCRWNSAVAGRAADGNRSAY
jgi:CDP-diacylglycerol--serine O-phosphatidyltransferase